MRSCPHVNEHRLRAHKMPLPLFVWRDSYRNCITGNKGAISWQHFENLPGVGRGHSREQTLQIDQRSENTGPHVWSISGVPKNGNGSLA